MASVASTERYRFGPFELEPDNRRPLKDDGNDGAHAGTLTKADAVDLLDFTFELLERLYTERKRLELAAVRREERRKPQA
jgi:hypothetical protein